MSPEKLISQATSSLYDGEGSHIPTFHVDLTTNASVTLAPLEKGSK